MPTQPSRSVDGSDLLGSIGGDGWVPRLRDSRHPGLGLGEDGWGPILHPVPSPDDPRRAAIASGDPSRAMPALAALRMVPDEEAIPLLLLGLEQETFMIRSLACAGLGVKRSEEGWQALVRALQDDADANVRAEAANALVSHSLQRAWPLLRAAFEADGQWLVRCSILSAVAEHQELGAPELLELSRMAIADGDGTVRVGGAEILGRLVREAEAADSAAVSDAREQARALLARLHDDPDHRVVAAALNGLQS